MGLCNDRGNPHQRVPRPRGQNRYVVFKNAKDEKALLVLCYPEVQPAINFVLIITRH